MQIIEKDISEIIPYTNNPRNNEKAVAAVACSIAEFGFKVPCVIDKKNILVTGHTRLLAAQKLGLTKIPCVIADDLTDAQIKAYRLADNRVAELASWDKDLLALELQQLNAIDFDMGALGFEADEMNSLENVTEDEPPEILEEPKTKPGQIFKLGEHRLMCGDSTLKSDLDKLLNGAKIDLLITDPPYNVNYEGRSKKQMKIKNDNMANDNFLYFLSDAFENANRTMKPGAAFYIWHAGLQSKNFLDAANETGWKIKSVLIWVKNNFVISRSDYQWKHEPCLYGWKDGAAHYFCDRRNEITVIEDAPDLKRMDKNQLRELCKKLLEPKEATTIIHEQMPTHNNLHPTMKPVKLFARLMLNSSKSGDNVLDIFGGSGTTIIAAEQLHRRAYAMELDPKYCDAIIARWEAHTGQKAERIS